ncbi:hypothetical protein [Ornithinibacillus halophilus]|nr:hypothetical protein [Ornithinibacillus halophilus]
MEIGKGKKYAVVVVAGQSNAVGYDESPVEYRDGYQLNSRVKQLGFNGDSNLKVIDLNHCAEDFQDMTAFSHPSSPERLGTKGMHLPLGNLLLDHIPDEYDVLIIPAAFGGTGFTTGVTGTYDETNMKPVNDSNEARIKWSSTSPFYLAMRDRLRYALDLNDVSIFLGVVWVQGEQDALDPATHFTEFKEMTSTFFDYFNENGYANRVKKGTFDKDIWYNVESTYYWHDKPGCARIWDNYKVWNPATYVPVARDTETNKVNGTGATTSNLEAHFGNNAYSKVIAPNVVNKMIENKLV